MTELERLRAIADAARAYVNSDPPRPEWRALVEALAAIDNETPRGAWEYRQPSVTVTLVCEVGHQVWWPSDLWPRPARCPALVKRSPDHCGCLFLAGKLVSDEKPHV